MINSIPPVDALRGAATRSGVVIPLILLDWLSPLPRRKDKVAIGVCCRPVWWQFLLRRSIDFLDTGDDILRSCSEINGSTGMVYGFKSIWTRSWPPRDHQWLDATGRSWDRESPRPCLWSTLAGIYTLTDYFWCDLFTRFLISISLDPLGLSTAPSLIDHYQKLDESRQKPVWWTTGSSTKT